MQPPPLTRAEFLAAPLETVAAVAPPTVIWSPGGTRRRAVLEGITIDDTYLEWGRRHMLDGIALFFRFGIRHLILPILGPHQLTEAGPYGERILHWTIQGMAGPTMLAEYRQRNWRARLIAPAAVPPLQAATAELVALPAPPGAPTVWYYCVLDDADPWQDLFAAVLRSGARTYAAAQQAVYGEEFPPATLLVGFGKPVLGTTLIPPLLCGPDLQCYWTQRAGVALPEAMLRAILYDFAYTRRTFRQDRRARYVNIERQRTLWDTTQTLGIGTAVGGFWYPASFAGAELLEAEDKD